MRVMVLAMTVMAVALVQAQSKPPKSMPADVGPGRLAWFDITTTDLSKSKEFYGKLFGWKFNPVQGTSLAVEIVSGGSAIGTIRVAEGQISSFNGVVYVQVLDIQERCKKAKELGGTLVPGFPFDLPNGTGAIGLVRDPAGLPWGCPPGLRSRRRSPRPSDRFMMGHTAWSWLHCRLVPHVSLRLGVETAFSRPNFLTQACPRVWRLT